MKIIVSKKAEGHMEVHEKEFKVDWRVLLKSCERNKKVQAISKDFEIIEIDFETPIGYCNLVEVKDEDEIIYARRIGRDIHTKFVVNEDPKITSKVTLILKRSYKKSDEYNLVTMYAGPKSHKEPEDINMSDKKELERSLEFWSRSALVYDEKLIEKDSIKHYCPYKNLYLAIS